MRLCNAAYAAGHHWFTFQLTNETSFHPERELTPRWRRGHVAGSAPCAATGRRFRRAAGVIASLLEITAFSAI